ncbi:MAG: MFS transporter [Anaerolineae bacterium]|nr:MFS transporter [Anaerolineae bacterium]
MQGPQQVISRWQIPFFAIWTGQAFSLVGSRLVQFALVWWLTETTGSATVLATGTIVAVLPAVILGPFAGALVDRWHRKRVMVAADAFVALVSAWLAYLFWRDALSTWHVYVAMFARSLGGSFHWPAMQASTSLMVPGRHLSRVAGLNQTLQGALGIVAPPLGAILISLMPLHAIMAIDVGTALMAIVPLLFVVIPQPEQAARDEGKGLVARVWADFWAGLRYVRAWPGLVAVLILSMVINLVINPAFSLMPLLVTEHFRGGVLELGGLQSAWGSGMLAGGLVLSVWGGFRRRVYTSLGGLVVGGLGMVGVGLTPADAFPLALGALFVSGAMNPLINGPLSAILQSTVAPEMQGRVFTLVSSAAMSMMPLSLAVAGPVADVVGVRPWFVVGGALFSLLGLGSLFVPAIVHLEEGLRAGGEREAVPTHIELPG